MTEKRHNMAFSRTDLMALGLPPDGERALLESRDIKTMAVYLSSKLTEVTLRLHMAESISIGEQRILELANRMIRREVIDR